MTASAEGDLTVSTNRDSPGRLLVLSDGVFAIALTLLALDLHVPDVGTNPTDRSLEHALGAQSSNYSAFLISFYVVAAYWSRHRRLMRSVETTDTSLVQCTLFLLLCVAALPFPAALLGKYGSHAISLVIYGGVNLLASLDLLIMHRIVQRHHLAAADAADLARSKREIVELVATVSVFALCIPAGFVFHGNGAWVLLGLLAVQRGRFVVNLILRLRRRLRQSRTAAASE